ncbi:MAG: hypothetical protein R2867_01410 [Caldilineaceae bacterium]
MADLRYTLITDGSSDASLIPILTWLLRTNGLDVAIQSTWADWRRLPKPPKTLREKIKFAVEFFPCDLLFIHRDAENQPREQRVHEIETAIGNEFVDGQAMPYICVVPIRMTEAWLLFDELAIRHAAGNRRGQQRFDLPTLARMEELPNPKQLLYECLQSASGQSGRRLKQFRVAVHARRVADFIEDFSPLRALSSFTLLERDIRNFIHTLTS